MSAFTTLRQAVRRNVATSSRIHFRAAVAPATSKSLSTRFYSSTVHENDPDVLDKEKQRNLEGKQHQGSEMHSKNAPGWNEYLASHSEANVKADQSESTPDVLVEETIKHVKKRHHAEDATVGVRADYEKDDVVGPLKTAASNAASKVKDVLTGKE